MQCCTKTQRAARPRRPSRKDVEAFFFDCEAGEGAGFGDGGGAWRSRSSRLYAGGGTCCDASALSACDVTPTWPVILAFTLTVTETLGQGKKDIQITGSQRRYGRSHGYHRTRLR
jgi:hypothetical protein